MGLKSTVYNCFRIVRFRPRGLAAFALLLSLCSTALAVEEDASTAVENAPLELPQVRHLAAALADEASREDTLLTLAVVARLLGQGSLGDPSSVPELEARFRDDRAWLDRLSARYVQLPLRPSLLDPAAWFLARELDQHSLLPGLLISPLGPDNESLLRELFARGDERLAASVLPEILPRMELEATIVWSRLFERLPNDPVLAELMTRLHADWFDPWIAAEPPAPTAGNEPADPVGRGSESLRVIGNTAVATGPPDALRLKRLRFELLTALPGLEPADARDAGYLLALAGAFDGLYRREYLAFTETLLWVASDLLLADPVSQPGKSSVPSLLGDLLPPVSNAYAAGFSDVDPRINSSVATVFDVMQYLQTEFPDPSRLASLRRQIADAVAELVLLIPDMDYYFQQPVREHIAEEINICISIVAARDVNGRATLSREQFEGCLESLVSMANEEVSRSELAGDPDGPFGTEQLRRELMLTPWQRINYVLGYFHEAHPTGCERPRQPLPNPLEWASLATFIVWFAKQAPVYFQTPQNESRIVAMRQRGNEIMQSWARQIDCISGSGSGLNDPVSRGLVDYRRALEDLVASLRQAELDFRLTHLKPGADVVLHGDAGQRTAFRGDDLRIKPCDSEAVCEMTGSLEATRALVGLFPDPYLIADQAGLGQVEICYDNVRWINRRSEPVRADDPHVANYFGQLSFDLLGRYRGNEGVTDIFGYTFVSPSEYHYLFAAADERVLGDSCPTEWVGSRIVTPLGPGERIRIVPDRLTYLAAARELPSQVIGANWNRNEEWRDRFVTGLDVTAHAYAPDASFPGRVNQHLQELYQSEQATLYNALFRPGSAAAPREDNPLFEGLQELTASKALLLGYMNLFYPQLMVDSGEIRGFLEGQTSLLDRSVLRRFRESGVAVSSIKDTGTARVERFQAIWNRQPEAVRRSGTNAISIAHAVTRLNSLYLEFFAPLPPEPDPPQAVSF